EKGIKELDGVKGEGLSGKAGYGPKARLHEARMKQRSERLTEKKVNPELERVKKEVETGEAEKTRRMADARREVENRDGLAARITAISNLGKSDPTYALISYFI